MVVALVLLGVAALLIAGAGAILVRRARTEAQEARGEAARADAELAVAERRGRQVLRDLPFVALRVDRDGRLVEANPVALERFPFLVAGMTMLEAFSEHRLARRVNAALEGLSRQSFEVRLFAGGRRTYRAAVEPYEVGDAHEALIFLTDQSEAVAYQELRSQFVANVSHELRTPLTGLRGLLEALDDPQMDPETRRDFVSRAASETQRLEALITDILFLSELETTPGLPSSSRSDLAQAAAATVADLQELAEEHGVRLELDADGAAWTPLTDRMAATVVRNLVENAVKYAGPGATAATTVRRVDDVVTLSVADDGAGIPERHLPHVFERFYRADPSRSKRLGGPASGCRSSSTSRNGLAAGPRPPPAKASERRSPSPSRPRSRDSVPRRPEPLSR